MWRDCTRAESGKLIERLGKFVNPDIFIEKPEGQVPLQTLRADVDYAVAEAHTTYGKLGIKVWIYKGEIFEMAPRSLNEKRPARPLNKGPKKPVNKEAKEEKSSKGGK